MAKPPVKIPTLFQNEADVRFPSNFPVAARVETVPLAAPVTVPKTSCTTPPPGKPRSPIILDTSLPGLEVIAAAASRGPLASQFVNPIPL